MSVSICLAVSVSSLRLISCKCNVYALGFRIFSQLTFRISCPLGDSDETNMSHVPYPPSETFLHPWFDHLRPRPKMEPPLGGVPRWVSGYRPAPWGTVMKPTCHMFLIHLVEHFCTLGLTT